MKTPTYAALFLLFPALALADSPLSSFNEVREVLLDQRAVIGSPEEQAELDVYAAGALPRYEVTAASFVKNGVDLLLAAALRTVSEKNDYYPRLHKLLHPNGICFTGTWEITEPSPYTGYFATGRKALFVARASVAMTETERGHKRGFGFAGKLFSTMDPNEPAPTANFFTVDVLSGTKAPHFTDVSMTNEPEVGFDLSSLKLGLRIAKTLGKADRDTGFRPLYPISELGLLPIEAVKTPQWIRIRAVPSTPKSEEADFRRELDIQNYSGLLRLEIAVSDKTKDPGATQGWQKLGKIDLRESLVSYGCDRQLHFAHPKMR